MLKNSLKIGGETYPIGKVSISVKIDKKTNPQGLEVNLVSDSDDSSTGGVALNCLFFPNTKDLASITGKMINFSSNDESGLTELSESVFWKPGIETLTIESLQIKFGPIEDDLIRIEISARCLDDMVNDVSVEMLVSAYI